MRGWRELLWALLRRRLAATRPAAVGVPKGPPVQIEPFERGLAKGHIYIKDVRPVSDNSQTDWFT